jgi:hypothetical protein
MGWMIDQTSISETTWYDKANGNDGAVTGASVLNYGEGVEDITQYKTVLVDGVKTKVEVLPEEMKPDSTWLVADIKLWLDAQGVEYTIIQRLKLIFSHWYDLPPQIP